jgi:hypothetical protein
MKTFAEGLNEKFAGKTVRSIHERPGDGYCAIVVEFETGDNSVLFLVADSKRLISHEESATVRDYGDEFDAADCMLQPGWLPYDRRPYDPPTIDPRQLENLVEL